MKRLLFLLACTGCADVLGPNDQFTGSFTGGEYIETGSFPKRADGSGGMTCTWVYTLSGKLHLKLKESGTSVSGEGTVDINESPVSATPGCGMGQSRSFDVGGPISGTMANFSFSGRYTATGSGVNSTTEVQFTGSISENAGAGTVTVQYSGTGVGEQAGATTSGSGRVSVTIGR